MIPLPPHAHGWPADRRDEARAVIADVAHHSDHLIRLACNVLIAHGESRTEREDAERLLAVIEARRPIHRAQREDQGRTGR
ncbi:hypothetical protein [Sedimentimonas flavescens]|uniref:hypothetical protein n=1 Tax=Sedimentimonas flavescens TaxID=2851012 RepID=UPI001C49EE91|nr:hypothetical protein [Sedimentimonas flavescens]MBW0159500.1 hypothetical protein [Sedimentimonas flavescens]